MLDVNKISQSILEFLVPLQRANWKIILLCLSTAATFWFFNALNKIYTTKIDFPIELVFDKDSLVMIESPPKEIPINVTGGGWQLLKNTISLDSQPILIEPESPLRTRFYTAGSLLPLFSSQLSDLNVNYVAIDTIYFQIDEISSRDLCIKLDSGSINLKKNHFITTPISLEPDTVRFRGAKSMVDKLPEIFSVSLSDKNLDSRYDEEISLDLFSNSIIKKDPEVIHIAFDVEEFIDQTAIVGVEQVNFPYDSSVYIASNETEIAFKLQRSFRNKLKNSDFLIIADLSNINVDTTITVEIMDKPPFVKDITILNNRIKVIYAE